MPEDDSEEREVAEPSLIPEATFENILCAYEQDEGEFTFVAGEGRTAMEYTGKRLTNLSASLKLGDEARAFREQYEKIRKTPAHLVPGPFKEWKPFAREPMDLKAAVMILAITRLLIKPKLTQLQCLRLHARGGQALMDIGGPLFSGATETAYQSEIEELDEAKNA